MENQTSLSRHRQFVQLWRSKPNWGARRLTIRDGRFHKKSVRRVTQNILSGYLRLSGGLFFSFPGDGSMRRNSGIISPNQIKQALSAQSRHLGKHLLRNRGRVEDTRSHYWRVSVATVE